MQQKNVIIEKYLNGDSLSELEREFSVSRHLIQKLLKKENVILRSHKETSKITNKKNQGRQKNPELHVIFSNEEFLRKRLIEDRQSIESLAREYKTSTALIYQYSKTFNIISDKKDNKNKIISEAEFLYLSGLNMEQVAEKLGYISPSISRWFQKNEFKNIRSSNEYPRKHNFISKAEIEVVEYIKSLIDHTLIIQSDRKILKGLELDILIPSKNIAFEFNGCLWHSEEFGKDSSYHKNKKDLCAKEGISLFFIWEDLWESSKEIVKSMIKSKLSLIENKVYARKCNIKRVDKDLKNLFLQKTHIQGKDSSSIFLGLFCEGELQSLMTFSKSRYNTKVDWELVRYASLLNTTVVGGFSKLLNFFRNEFKGSIVSYSDNDYSDGAVYKTCGFTLLENKAPSSYFYYDCRFKKRYHRSAFMKKTILKKYPERFSKSQTEKEMMRELKYLRCWNSGMKTWILSK